MTAVHTVIPVRLSAWVSGDLGHVVEDRFRDHLAGLGGLKLRRLPRALMVESAQSACEQLAAVERACRAVQEDLAKEYPRFWRELGPMWTGALLIVFEVPP